MRNVRTSLTTFAVSLLVALAIHHSTLVADEPPPPASPGAVAASASTLRGIVRDPSGKPAAKATVWLVVHRNDAFEPPLKTETDAKAPFTFSNLDHAKLFVRGTRVTIAARDDAGHIGWCNYTGSERPEPLCEVRLRETTLITGRAFNPEGQPLAGARLTPKSFWDDGPAAEEQGNDRSLALWPELAKEYAAVTRDDGVFEASGIPRGVKVRCELVAQGIEQAETVIEAGVAATIRLGKPGSIAGQLAAPNDQKLPLAGFQLEARLQPDPKRPQEPAVILQKTATVDEEGRFKFSDLPPGRYVIQPIASQNVPFAVDLSPVIDLKAGEQLDDVSVPLILCREVRGRVVERGTSQGVESVEIVVSTRRSAAAPNRIGMTNAHAQTVITNAEGRFSAWLPPDPISLFMRRVPDKYLPPAFERVQPEFDDAPLIEVAPAVAIEGIVVDENHNPIPLALLDIKRAPLVSRGGGWQDLPEQADQAGKFVARQLAPDEPLLLRARTSTAVSPTTTIVPNEAKGPVELVVSESQACRFTGRVLDRKGNALPATRVAIMARRLIPLEVSQGSFGRYTQITYPAVMPRVANDGSFQTEALYPDDTYHLAVTLAGYGDRASASVPGEAGRTHDFGTIVLDEFARLGGLVVDAAGNPVANAELRVSVPDHLPQAALGLVEVRSDAAGAFELPPVPREGVLRIWGRAGAMTTDGAESFFADVVDGPLRIVLGEKHACRIAGKVVDAHGKPVRASLSVTWQWQPKSTQRSAGFNAVLARPFRRRTISGPVSLAAETADDGTFVVSGLWSDETYHLLVKAEGYEPSDSAIRATAAGSTFEAGTIVLRRSDLVVEGQVVDSDGKPIEKASVFNSGDAQEPITVETDAAGRFRVEGLSEGPVYLFVRKPGYWPAGLRCAAGDVGQSVSLVDDQHGRPRKPLALSLDRGPSPERRELARQLLTELWQLRDSPTERRLVRARGGRGAENGPHGEDIVRRMVRLDYEQALKWSAAEGGAFDELIRIVAFDQIVHDNVDLAIAHAQAPGGSQALKRMASRRIIDGARDDAVRLLEAALHGNLATEYYWRRDHADITAQAEIGRLAIAAGRVEWGRQLINDAADRVERLGGEAQAQTRVDVAAALASFDSARSVRVWEMQPPPNGGVSNNLHDDLAVSVGMYDMEAARHIAAQANTGRSLSRRGGFAPLAASASNDFDAVLVRVAYRLARNQPERALVMLKEIPDNHRLERAEALGRVAVALAPRRPQAAYKLFEEALDLCSGVPLASQGFFQADRAETAARIALLATEAGYPDQQSLGDRALATRFEERLSAARSESLIKMAWALALIDPRLARDLLQHAAPPEAAVDDFQSAERIGKKWLQAWTMADLDHAVALFHQVLADQGPAITADCINYGLLPMVDALLWMHEGGPSSMLPQDGASWLEPLGAE